MVRLNLKKNLTPANDSLFIYVQLVYIYKSMIFISVIIFFHTTNYATKPARPMSQVDKIVSRS